VFEICALDREQFAVDTQQWLDPQRLAEIVDDHVSYVGLASTCASYVGQQTTSGQGR